MTESATTANESLDAGWRAALTHEDVKSLLELHDLRSWLSIGLNWAVVFASFALVGIWPNLLTIVAALFLIGARQLGFAVLMHEPRTARCSEAAPRTTG